MLLTAESSTRMLVALLAEGVDRNFKDNWPKFKNKRSPSSRRAWIEISCGSVRTEIKEVALLAEGVDRNIGGSFQRLSPRRSPSSRRACIEIE